MVASRKWFLDLTAGVTGVKVVTAVGEMKELTRGGRNFCILQADTLWLGRHSEPREILQVPAR